MTQILLAIRHVRVADHSSINGLPEPSFQETLLPDALSKTRALIESYGGQWLSIAHSTCFYLFATLHEALAAAMDLQFESDIHNFENPNGELNLCTIAILNPRNTLPTLTQQAQGEKSAGQDIGADDLYRGNSFLDAIYPGEIAINNTLIDHEQVGKPVLRPYQFVKRIHHLSGIHEWHEDVYKVYWERINVDTNDSLYTSDLRPIRTFGFGLLGYLLLALGLLLLLHFDRNDIIAFARHLLRI